MLEKLNPVLRLVCLALAGLVVYQGSRVLLRKDPLKDLNLGMGMVLEEQPKSTSTNATGTGPKPPVSRAGGPAMAMAAAALPTNIQMRIDRVVESEILGMVQRPMPTALLGIAGNHAFLRTANGQTGLLKEGDELGGVKVLKISANRVLVEENQEKKELMIFSGFGSETLLPKGDTH